MSFWRRWIVCVVCLVVTQQALLAQSNAVIDQARLFRDTNTTAGVREGGAQVELVTEDATEADDDSMGVQQILKEHEQRPTLVITAGASEVFTSNAALTRSDTRHDLFAVANVGIVWTPRVSPTVEVNAAANASVFRYVRTPELNFENLSAGAGVAWTPQALRGFSVFARYDFTQLLDDSGDHILSDHVFTGGAQKVFAFGRAQALTVGVNGSLGFSDPVSAQRHQAGGFANYHVQIARDFGVDLLWRPAAHFYEELDRVDFNSVVSFTLRYRIGKNADLSAFASYGTNRSETEAFDYNVLTTGAGVTLSFRF
jgi:hypothetical protein